MKNNVASAPLTVTPVLRLASGEEIPLTPVTIAANGSVSVGVNESLQEHAPEVLGKPDSYGSVVFHFSSFHEMNLQATAIASFHGESAVFPIRAHPSSLSLVGLADALRAIAPGSLEGIWWQPRSGLNDFLVFSNSSNTTVSGTLSLFDASGKRWRQALPIGPHQVERMPIGDLVREAGLSGRYGGISLEVPASASALDGVHFMYDEEGKFSASLEMFSRDPNATVLQRTGKDQKQWTIRAPMLALLNPDPALG